MNRFEPRDTLRNGHWMTLYSWGNPRSFPLAATADAVRYFDVAHDARVVADCHWQRAAVGASDDLALHGLNGSRRARTT